MMVRRKSRFPLLVVLWFAAGWSVCVWWQGSTPQMKIREDVAAGRDPSGEAPENFGPVPLASASGEVAVKRAPPDLLGLSDEMKLLAARMDRETSGLKVVEHADGRRSVSLEGRFHHMSAMVSGAGEKQEIRCFNDFNEMAAALPAGRSVNPPPPPSHDR
jgi:hypothetical protein